MYVLLFKEPQASVNRANFMAGNMKNRRLNWRNEQDDNCIQKLFFLSHNLSLTLLLYPNLFLSLSLSLRLMCASASFFSHLSPAVSRSSSGVCSDTLHPAQVRKHYATWMSWIQFRYATWKKRGGGPFTKHWTGTQNMMEAAQNFPFNRYQHAPSQIIFFHSLLLCLSTPSSFLLYPLICHPTLCVHDLLCACFFIFSNYITVWQVLFK